MHITESMLMDEVLKERARHLRKNMTDAEQKLWQNVRQRQLNGLKFRRQVIVGEYIVDFACFEAKLIIELDDGQHAENTHYDDKRTQYLTQQGFQVVRFWNHEVLNQLDAVLERVLKKLCRGKQF